MLVRKALLLLSLMAAVAWANVAQATIIGFDYLLHVGRIEQFGNVPASWLAALALVVLACGRWLWRTYFSAYDKDGLPRGPRL